MPTGSQIREMFLRYFEAQKEKPHKRVHSSSLVPHNDPTLLFTNAGMNQFKDVFLGLEKRDYSRATTAQKCVRAGGKHNDLENVGFTNRHHTFFEMLGNFSFGDYFKKDAVAFAWELVTSKDWFGIPKDKLYVTIFKGEQGVARDSEAYEHWLAQGVAKERIFELGMKDNFWAMGDTGPCGPCSEIHYDMGPAASDQGHTDCKFGCECGRYVEIWNLVFMQYNRYCTHSRGEPYPSEKSEKDHRERGLHSPDCLKLEPLPRPCVDTGAGLERLAATALNLQDASKVSNYETDLFQPLIEETVRLLHEQTTTHSIAELAGGKYGAASVRVIADHSRAMTFLISDGVLPGNDRRGYVLRKIIRRAIRHGRLYGSTRPFLFRMVPAVVKIMRDAYPELSENEVKIANIVKAEEVRFNRTLEGALGKLEEDIAQIFKEALAVSRTDLGNLPTPIIRAYLVEESISRGEPLTYEGQKAFKLYDTFGLPRDFIEDACRDTGIIFDSEGFDRAMAEQRERARASWKGGAGKATASPVFRELKKTEFEGYKQLVSDANVLAILKHGASAPELLPGEVGEIVLDVTPFYADSGGQVGDVGILKSRYDDLALADVVGCYQPVQGVRAHRVKAKERIIVNDQVRAIVNEDVRVATMRNHTATHLLHAALRETLGKHVKQAGSLVDPAHLRFDFSHFTGVADEELQDIEDLANKEVLRNQK
ncbi:MAG TPA: alanine--tRNA ligase, partial [Terriglobales bacterium]|nr:alanine--tRNA ligase [Terriglobales bacterium]